METKFLGIFGKKKAKEGFEHKILTSDYLPIVQGVINGRKAYFLLDTGASVSMLDTSQKKDFGFEAVGLDDTTIGGYGGLSLEVSKLEKYKVEIGTELMRDDFLGKDLKYLVEPIQENTGYKITGIIGSNNIMRSGLIIDFKNNKLTK